MPSAISSTPTSARAGRARRARGGGRRRCRGRRRSDARRPRTSSPKPRRDRVVPSSPAVERAGQERLGRGARSDVGPAEPMHGATPRARGRRASASEHDGDHHRVARPDLHERLRAAGAARMPDRDDELVRRERVALRPEQEVADAAACACRRAATRARPRRPRRAAAAARRRRARRCRGCRRSCRGCGSAASRRCAHASRERRAAGRASSRDQPRVGAGRRRAGRAPSSRAQPRSSGTSSG